MSRTELTWRIQRMENLLNQLKFGLAPGPLSETAIFILILEENVAILKELVDQMPEETSS